MNEVILAYTLTQPHVALIERTQLQQELYFRVLFIRCFVFVRNGRCRHRHRHRLYFYSPIRDKFGKFEQQSQVLNLVILIPLKVRTFVDCVLVISRRVSLLTCVSVWVSACVSELVSERVSFEQRDVYECVCGFMPNQNSEYNQPNKQTIIITNNKKHEKSNNHGNFVKNMPK